MGVFGLPVAKFFFYLDGLYMMEIQFVRIQDKLHIQLEGGWVTTKIVDRVLDALKATCWNFKAETLSVYQSGRGNVIDIMIEEGRANDVQEFCDYLNVILREVIPTAFTEINVSPYSLPEYDNRGGLDLLVMIAKETGCEVDYGEWMKPVVFKPISNVQYAEVTSLLRTFKMTFHNYVTKEV